MNSNEKEKSQVKLCKDNQIHFRIKLQETVVFNTAGLSKYNQPNTRLQFIFTLSRKFVTTV